MADNNDHAAAATDELPGDIQTLINNCFDVMQYSYSPYSNFPVGAAVLTLTGQIFTGCNVENASYPVGVCAEKVALTKAVSEGHRKFKAIAITSEMKDKFISPCGTCRQFLIEFGSDYDVYMVKPDRTWRKNTVGELLPLSFAPEDLQIVN